MYYATLYPDRITVRYDWDNRTARQRWEERMERNAKDNYVNLTKKKTTWKMSYQTKRKIYDSAGYLNAMAKRKTIKTKSGKLIYNFRTAFITLTLPSKQEHPDIEIKKCLNQFFTQLRSKFNLKNYIWKAELQQNNDIHFHIITDIYVHHSAVRYYWNQAINVLGYVDRYCEKYSKMSLKEYAQSRNLPVSKAISGYIRGRETKWKSPPTEQVVSVKNKAGLATYISKYIAKDVAETDEESQATIQRIQSFGRVWGRSQSLSRIKFITRYDWQSLAQAIKTIDASFKSFIVKKYDYCTILYFNFNQLNGKMAKWLHRKMSELAITFRYPIPE